MAAFLCGMNAQETVALTRAMTASGRRLDWRPFDLTGPGLDKHSTDGVGAKVSRVLSPILAACGDYVPMRPGRGLAHPVHAPVNLEATRSHNSPPTITPLPRGVATKLDRRVRDEVCRHG